MTTTIIARYLTRSGKIAVEAKKTSAGENVAYHWSGSFGAGSFKTLDALVDDVRSALTRRSGVTLDHGRDLRVKWAPDFR